MTSEQKYLLQCLSDFICGKDTDFLSINIDILEELASAHNVTGIIYYQSARIPERSRFFHNSFLQSVFLSVNRGDIFKEIVTRFREAGIELICMKGSVFRDCYPIPELRSMGDVDFIIHTRDREKSNQILMSEMGFERMIDNHAVWTYWLSHFMFEVHDHMFYENLANQVDYRDYFDQVWEHRHHASVFGIEAENLYVPDESFHFLYLMAHTAKHVINSGSGFRAFLDMILLTKKCNLDWEWLKIELEKLDLLDFTRTCFALCERWFNVRMPLGEKCLDESFFKEITEKTFRDGIFGLDNQQNVGAHAAKEIKRDDRAYLTGAIQLTIGKLFPPYEDMQLIPWYSWVDGRPWLLPAAWVYRWYYCIRNKRKHSFGLLTEPFSRREIVEKREGLIRSWGL